MRVPAADQPWVSVRDTPSINCVLAVSRPAQTIEYTAKLSCLAHDLESCTVPGEPCDPGCGGAGVLSDIRTRETAASSDSHDQEELTQSFLLRPKTSIVRIPVCLKYSA